MVMRRTEDVVDSVEAAAAAFERTATPLAVLRVIGNIVQQAAKVNKRRR